MRRVDAAAATRIDRGQLFNRPGRSAKTRVGECASAQAETVLKALEPLSGYVDDAKWDAVRTVLKTSPVAELWNLGASKNWIRKVALDNGAPAPRREARHT